MRSDLVATLRPALVLALLLAGLTGILYPLAITGVAQLAVPAQANGSLLRDGSTVRGSALIGQAFASPRYFHGRPSAAGKGYDPLASGGSNLGPASRTLADRVRADLAANRQINRQINRTSPDVPTPADLVTASASGLDPDISPEAALYQAPRVAAARGLPLARVRALVAREADGPVLGVIGEPGVNVLRLNRALDAEAGRP
jgi:potassium-transporting ATPase KdpC subunit